MKTFNLFVVMMLVFNAGAADALTEKLQRGLFEEEANHNLDAAIKEYQSVVAQSDEQRKVTATALFRLGECYRKLGRTNEAHAQYQRILRDFSEQEQLVRLSSDLLPRPSVVNTSVATVTDPAAVNLLREEIGLAEQAVQTGERALAAGRGPLSDVVNAKKDVLRLKRQLPENAAPARQRALLEEQIEIVKQHLAYIGKLAPDRLAPSEAFSIQRELLSLQRELAGVSAGSFPSEAATGRSAESELVRELEREEARLSAELTQANSHLNTLNRMQREKQFDAAAQLSNDKGLATLQEQLRAAEQKLATEGTTLAAGHPEMQRLTALRQTIVQQRDEALTGLIMAQKNRATALMNDLDTVRSQLQRSAPTLTQAETEALARVKTLARNSPDLLQNPSKDGLSELQLAAREGYYSVVEFILSQGISPNGPERGSSPVALAASRGHLRIIELLLERRADVNREDRLGDTALILASLQGFKSVVELLLARGANVNHADNEQKTALIYAAQKGFTAVAELLLERGADVNRADKLNSTALHYAAAYGFAPMTKLLLEKGAKPDVLSIDHSGRPERDLRGQVLWVDRGATALHLAAKGEFVPVVQALLAGGASTKAVNYIKVTPLHLAAEKGNSNICALLLEKGVDPNLEDAYGNTPFSRAINAVRAETVSLLVAKGADLNRPIVIQGSQNYPQYPLHIALATTPDVLDAILQGKPNLEVVNKSGWTPLRQAAGQNNTEMVEKLLAAGANPNQRTSQPEALFAAVYQNDPKPELVAALLKHGANPNIVDGGRTPLSHAEGRSKSSRNSGAVEWEGIAVLLRQHGANEYLQRLSIIGYTRPAWTSGDRGVFYRGTNDYNRYTLFEFLAAVFNSQNVPAFPDLARITIERLEGTNPRPKEISLNVEQLLSANDCAKDMWLEWGDRVSIPELDHGLNEGWTGLSKQTQDLLARCVTRRVQIIVKQETNVVKLVQGREDQAVPGMPPTARPIPLLGGVNIVTDPNAVPTAKPEKTLATFRLKESVYGANVLRASSDPTAARVTRADGAGNKTNQWTVDLTKVATAGEWTNQREGKLWNLHDLWLRDGDVIEIPEKQ